MNREFYASVLRRSVALASATLALVHIRLAPMHRLLPHARRLLGWLVLAGWSATVMAQSAPQHLPTLRLNAGIHLIQAELAQTAEERSVGLMFRKTMPANAGMLFVFPQAGVQCFWMKNTLLPLSVAFIADDGSIVNIEQMKPQTLDSHCSTRAVRFVLEMNQGWFAERGIKPASKIHGTPFGN